MFCCLLISHSWHMSTFIIHILFHGSSLIYKYVHHLYIVVYFIVNIWIRLSFIYCFSIRCWYINTFIIYISCIINALLQSLFTHFIHNLFWTNLLSSNRNSHDLLLLLSLQFIIFTAHYMYFLFVVVIKNRFNHVKLDWFLA